MRQLGLDSSILTKSVEVDQASQSIVRLINQDELPQDARLNFFLKTAEPETLPTGEKVEAATVDESFHVLLSLN